MTICPKCQISLVCLLMMSDNKIISGAMDKSPCIYLTDEIKLLLYLLFLLSIEPWAAVKKLSSSMAVSPTVRVPSECYLAPSATTIG